MTRTFHIINGPNLNLIGIREPDIYGEIGFDEYVLHLKRKYKDYRIGYFQSNHEGDLIDKLQEVGFDVGVGIVLNAGAYSHTSIALSDAVRSIKNPVVEVHISDIKMRESFRQHSFISEVADYVISGQGMIGYDQAIDYLIDMDY